MNMCELGSVCQEPFPLREYPTMQVRLCLLHMTSILIFTPIKLV